MGAGNERFVSCADWLWVYSEPLFQSSRPFSVGIATGLSDDPIGHAAVEPGEKWSPAGERDASPKVVALGN